MSRTGNFSNVFSSNVLPVALLNKFPSIQLRFLTTTNLNEEASNWNSRTAETAAARLIQLFPGIKATWHQGIPRGLWDKLPDALGNLSNTKQLKSRQAAWSSGFVWVEDRKVKFLCSTAPFEVQSVQHWPRICERNWWCIKSKHHIGWTIPISLCDNTQDWGTAVGKSYKDAFPDLLSISSGVFVALLCPWV